jgi:hypothetical protein
MGFVEKTNVAGNTIPTAREEAGRDSLRGESRPAFILCARLVSPRTFAVSPQPESGVFVIQQAEGDKHEVPRGYDRKSCLLFAR